MGDIINVIKKLLQFIKINNFDIIERYRKQKAKKKKNKKKTRIAYFKSSKVGKIESKPNVQCCQTHCVQWAVLHVCHKRERERERAWKAQVTYAEILSKQWVKI